MASQRLIAERQTTLQEFTSTPVWSGAVAQRPPEKPNGKRGINRLGRTGDLLYSTPRAALSQPKPRSPGCGRDSSAPLLTPVQARGLIELVLVLAALDGVDGGRNVSLREGVGV